MSEPSPGEAGGGQGGGRAQRGLSSKLRAISDVASLRPHPIPPPPSAGEGVRRAFLAFAFALLVSACGFQPLYGEGPGVPSAAVAAMAETRVALIADRAGQELRNNLLDRLTPRGQPSRPRYELQVGLAERRDNLGISRDDSATYARLTLTATFSLREVASGQVVTSGQSQWTNGFTVVASHFANLTSEADARSRALREIGEDIRQKLGLHFSKPAG